MCDIHKSCEKALLDHPLLRELWVPNYVKVFFYVLQFKLLNASSSLQVRSVQSVVAASSQQVATGQQIRTSAVTTAVVMSSSTQPIVTTRMITGKTFAYSPTITFR
jgi:hypothetical protein